MDSAPRAEDEWPLRVEDAGEEGAERIEMEETVTGSQRDTLPAVPSGPEREEGQITNSSVERNCVSINLALLQSTLVEVGVGMDDNVSLQAPGEAQNAR